MSELRTIPEVKRVLQEAKTIAVLGAHPSVERPAHFVPSYLSRQGYRVLPVNPMYVGQQLFGKPVVARLDAITERVDIVDVFRPSADVLAHVEEILAMKPRPGAVWLQTGIRNDEAARLLVAEGIHVVQDRCTLADHRAFGIGRRR